MVHRMGRGWRSLVGRAPAAARQHHLAAVPARCAPTRQPNAEDTGFDQLARIVEVPGQPDVRVADIQLPKARVLRRAVATKELKGRTMVRKLMLWQTNKEAVSAEHPAYVLLLTDYSPNRSTPLEREIRVSSSRDQLETLWKTWSDGEFRQGLGAAVDPADRRAHCPRCAATRVRPAVRQERPGALAKSFECPGTSRAGCRFPRASGRPTRIGSLASRPGSTSVC